MPFVINELCADTKSGECVAVCPVDCIHPTPEEAEAFAEVTQLYIDPKECIDCGACLSECPVDAITPEEEVPEAMASAIKENARYFQT